jgi:hypothetical protein
MERPSALDAKILESARKIEVIAAKRQQIASDYVVRAYAAHRNLLAGTLGSGLGTVVLALLPTFSSYVATTTKVRRQLHSYLTLRIRKLAPERLLYHRLR